MQDQLPKTSLGKTEIQITRLGYGSGHRKPMNDKQRDVILNAVVDAGINIIDTAISYGNSEQLIGKFLKDKRDKFYLATKGNLWDAGSLETQLNQSLKRLKTDYVDIYQLHNPTPAQCISGELLDALNKFKKSGKCRWIGVSTSQPYFKEFIEWNSFDIFQVPYSALQMENEKMINIAGGNGAGVIINGAVALGEPNIGKGSKLIWDNFENYKLQEFLDVNETKTSFMLRFTLSNDNAHTAIVGTTNPKHLESNIKSVLQGPLEADLYNQVKKRIMANLQI
ncbi:MAG: aldo/keto reductase [SAR202 cluster bacterium]|nr:aldo/keto reductase [Chloroflexota bacterium]MQG39464.1 aldo/keto reductase [SAR202 cluster bacterium]|tara:strand:+ start:1361 stop:2203 length:843 start_codon:yes stop_codon:yes gene_type:complete